uniref:Uncharacterized protein n=1 Tax=Naja naja TaxID=35670 RepID=A0A8C6VHT8_NAJNA
MDDKEFNQNSEFTDSSQPCESYTSSSETPVESCQELSPKSNSKLTAILYTYNGLCNKRAMVYIGSFKKTLLMW